MPKTRKNPKTGEDEEIASLFERVSVKEAMPIILTLGSIVATAFLTFQTTKGAFQNTLDSTKIELQATISTHEGRIAKLEARLKTNEFFMDTKDRALVYYQRNALRLLRDEFSRLEKFFGGWTPPKFTFGKRNPYAPLNIAEAPFEMVVGRKDGPLNTQYSTRSDVLYTIVMTDNFRALPDHEFVAKAQKIQSALLEFSEVLREQNLPTGAFAQYNSQGVFFLVPRDEAEMRLADAKKTADRLKVLLEGMSKQADDLLREYESKLGGAIQKPQGG